MPESAYANSDSKLLYALALVPVVAFLIFSSPDASTTISDILKSSPLPVATTATCYADKFPSSRHSDLLETYGEAKTCADRGFEATVCPQHGVCYDGKVVGCDYLTSLPLLYFSDGVCSLNSDGKALEAAVLEVSRDGPIVLYVTLLLLTPPPSFARRSP